MEKIALWCTVASAEAWLLPYTLAAHLDHPAVSRLVVVYTSAHPPAEFGVLARLSPKSVEVHKPFGSGFDKSLADGGYDQLSARNYAISLVEESGADWMFQLDADEFVHPQLLTEIAMLGHQFDAVCMSYYTLCSATSYWQAPLHRRSVNGVELHHPRILAWRRSLLRRCEPCPASLKNHVNTTRHASVSFAHHPLWKIYPVHQFPVYHLHCLLGKEHADRRTAAMPIDHVPPPLLLQMIWRIQQQEASHVST